MSDLNVPEAAVKIMELWVAEQHRTVLNPWESLAFGLTLVLGIFLVVGVAVAIVCKVAK